MKDPNKASPYWTLTFERGETKTDAGLAPVFAGITSLDANSPKNGRLTLSKYSAGAELLGFAQTGAVANAFILWELP